MEDTRLKQVESICSDRFSNYVIIGVDGEGIFWTTSSKISGYGMLKYAIREIEKSWDGKEKI